MKQAGLHGWERLAPRYDLRSAPLLICLLTFGCESQPLDGDARGSSSTGGSRSEVPEGVNGGNGRGGAALKPGKFGFMHSSSTGSGEQGSTTGSGGSANGGSASAGGAGGDEPYLPLESIYCGDGIRDITLDTKEECDDFAGSERDLCTERCQVGDALAARGPAQGSDRYLGEGRHPAAAGPYGFGVAFVEPDAQPPVVGLAVFDAAGDPRARVATSSGGKPVLLANPVLAALPDGSYAVAWTDFGGDSDVLGVALRRVTPDAAPSVEPPALGVDLGAALSEMQFANEESNYSQYDPDILLVDDTLVVAWTDASAEGADIKYRIFEAEGAGPDGTFLALGSEQTLSDEDGFESNVALAPFDGGFAAAWRATGGGGEETVEVAIAGGTRFTIGPHLGGPVEDHPALAELDADHLLVIYSVGTDPEATGSANVSRLRAAVLELGEPEPVSDFALTPADPDYADEAIAQSHPNLVRAGDVLYAAWRSGARGGDSEAENVFIRAFAWDAGELVSGAIERRIPRWPDASFGDQRFPALAVGPRQLGAPGLPEPAPLGALVLAWDDYGQNSGADQGRPDVFVQHWPLPVVRFPDPRRTDCSVEDPCEPGEGHCQGDAECQAGLVCLAGQGPKYGLPPGVSVCVPSHCTNGQQDADETAIDCGGAQCGTCLCGDGVVMAANGEECDDEGESAECDIDCTFAECGDGSVNGSNGESCDDGNQVETDSCRNSCAAAFCGDGVVWADVEACDTAGASPTCNADCTQPPGIWTPDHLSPAAWYLASPSDVIFGSGSALAQWSDRSGNGRHIAASNAFLQPIYNASGWNGAQPTVTFDGSKMLWREPWDGPPAGDDAAFTVLAVMRSAASHVGGVAAWWDAGGGGNTWCMVKTDHGSETVLETTRMDFLSRGQILRGRHDLGTGRHVVAWRFSPEEMKLTVDGTTTSLPQDSIAQVTLGTFLVGALNLFGSNRFQGDISELVIVPEGISDFEVAQFRSYARQTWTGLPASSPGPNPCTTASGQPSLPSKACDDGVATTYGDRCQSGTCAGSVPSIGSPAGFSPAAWYVASSSEVTLDTGSVASQWLDRSGNGRHVMQAHPSYKPSFVPTGWNETKPTLAFTGSQVLRKNSWSGSPEGHDVSFTVLAVTRSAQAQSGGPFGWGHLDGYWQVRSSLTNSSGATLLGLFRQDDFANQSFSLPTDLKTERHVVAWRYSPEVMKLTVDGTTASSPTLASLNPLFIDTFLIGVDNVLGFNPFRGEISELAVIPSSISDPEVADFRSYAQATWGGLPACGWGPGDTQCAATEFCDYDGVCKTRPCSLSDPWASMIQVVDSDFVDGVAVSPDGLTAYVAAGVEDFGNIYVGTRTNTNSQFTNLQLVPNVNTNFDERGPWLSGDGLRLYFSTRNTASGFADLVVSTRSSTGAAFGAPQALPTVNYASERDLEPFFAPEEQVLYFTSRRPTEFEIYFSTLTNGVFSTPQVVPAINSTSQEGNPVLSRDGLRIFFRSRRPSAEGDTDGDVWMAERASTGVDFNAPVNVSTLNTSGIDFPVSMSADGCRLYIASNRLTGFGGVNNTRLFEVRRAPQLASVTVTMVVTGNGSNGRHVGAPFNCAVGQTCAVQLPFGTRQYTQARNSDDPVNIYWSGTCVSTSSDPLNDGANVYFGSNATCTATFP